MFPLDYLALFLHSESMSFFLFLQMPASQKSVSSETRCKPQPEPQTSHDSEKDAPLLSEPRRVKIFDGG